MVEIKDHTIAAFKHDQKDGLAVLLRKAADAIESNERLWIDKIDRLSRVNRSR